MPVDRHLVTLTASDGEIHDALLEIDERAARSRQRVSGRRTAVVHSHGIMGNFLVGTDVITEDQLRASSDELRKTPGARHGEILVRMGFVGKDDLGSAVRKQVQAILWSLFNWDEGEVSFEVGRARDDEVFKIKVPAARAIIAGCRRIADPKTITARMGGRGAVLKRLPCPPHLENFRLEPDELELLEFVNGKRTLYELCESGSASPGANVRVLYALSELQFVSVDPSASGKILIQVRA